MKKENLAHLAIKVLVLKVSGANGDYKQTRKKQEHIPV